MLAFACAFTMFAGAAFTDSADIETAEAVDTLVALGVVDGYTDGSFQPNGTVTRAEMAKMIYVVRTGRSDASAYNNDKTTFTDIADHWARGYIKYCQSLGIIAGKSTTRFAPDETVTTAEAAKMLLVTLGYNAEKAGLVGLGWDSKTVALADENGLLKDVNCGTSSAAPRQFAAQLIYNTIFAPTVALRDGEYTNMNLLGTAKLETVGEKFMGLIRTAATVNGDSKSISSLKAGEMQVNVLAAGTEAGAAGNKTITYTVDDIESLVGMEVDILWKESKDSDNNLDKKDTIYGIYENGNTDYVIATSDDVEESGTATDGEIKVNGTKYDIVEPGTTATDLVIYNQGGYAADTSNDVADHDGEAIFVALDKQNGDTIKFILNDEGKITKAYVTKTVQGTVTAVNSKKVTISGLGAVEFEDNSIYTGIAKDDVVNYTKYYDTTLADAYVVVEKAEKVTGTVTGYKGAESVTVDGTVYKTYNNTTLASSVAGESGITSFGTSHIEETVDLYLVNGYVAGAVQVSESETNYSLVVDKNGGTAGSTLDPLKIEVMDAAGDKKTLTVNDKGDTSIDEGDIVTYTMKGDEAKVTVETEWATGTTSTANFYKKDAKTLEGTVTSADCVLFVQTASGKTVGANGAEYKAYSIRNLKDITTTGKDYKTVEDDGKVVAAIINLAGTPSGATSDVVYGIVISDNGTSKIDDTYYNEYTIWAGEEIVVKIEDGLSNDTLTKGTIYGFAPSADGLYDDNTDFVSVSNSSLASVTVDGSTYDADVVWVDKYDESEQILTYFEAAGSPVNGVYPGATKVTKAVADDVKIVYVDVDNDAAGDEIGVNAFDTQTGYANAIIVLNSDGAISHIVVETSGEDNVYAVNA